MSNEHTTKYKTNLIHKGTLESVIPCNVKEIERNINIEISKVTTWLQRNKLQLNVSKSKFMVFFKHPKTLPKLNITANGNLIGQVSEFNFLGITIDENITWNPHIRNTSIKIARVIGILRKLKRIFSRHILRLIYNSLIHPHLLYGLSLWGFKQKRITVLQKKSCKNYCISNLYISFHFSF